MPYRLKLADIMTRDVITLSEDDSLADARSCMDRGRIRHLPVIRGKKLVGLVTHRDLLAASFSVFAEVSEREQRRLFSQIPVKELMHDAITAPPHMPVREAAEILLKNKFGCLPVVTEERDLVGIVTEADFLKLTVKVLEVLERG